jgi:hypothetical protein
MIVVLDLEGKGRLSRARRTIIYGSNVSATGMSRLELNDGVSLCNSRTLLTSKILVYSGPELV